MTARQSSALGSLVVDLCRRLGHIEGQPDETAALAAEAKARASADRGNSEAILAEAQARADADKALAARQTKLSGTLTLPANLAIGAGKTLRPVTVAGLKALDDITVTPKAALPPGIAMSETYCAADGVLTIALTAVTLVTIASKTDVPLGVVVLR